MHTHFIPEPLTCALSIQRLMALKKLPLLPAALVFIVLISPMVRIREAKEEMIQTCQTVNGVPPPGASDCERVAGHSKSQFRIHEQSAKGGCGASCTQSFDRQAPDMAQRTPSACLDVPRKFGPF